MCAKFVTVVICLLALIGISAGIKCYDGFGDKDGKFEEKDCPNNNACGKVECDGTFDGKAQKFCATVPDVNAKCNAASSGCYDAKGTRSPAKTCGICGDDLCNSAFHHPITISLLMVFGAGLAVIGHFLV